MAQECHVAQLAVMTECTWMNGQGSAFPGLRLEVSPSFINWTVLLQKWTPTIGSQFSYEMEPAFLKMREIEMTCGRFIARD